MAFGDYQLEIYLQGLGGVVPTLPMSFAELEERAQAAMPPSIWSYVAGGAGDERTQRVNVSAFDRWGLMPRMLVGATERGCEGGCRTTALTARFGASTRMLDRAVYGLTIEAGQPTTAHVEAYRGGGAGCPTEASPTPHYTLVLGAVPVPTVAATVTSPGNLLGFEGDLLGGALGARATAVTLTPVAVDVCPTCVGGAAPSDPDGFIALDASLTFEGGTVSGHLFATHCDSLDTRG